MKHRQNHKRSSKKVYGVLGVVILLLSLVGGSIVWRVETQNESKESVASAKTFSFVIDELKTKGWWGVATPPEVTAEENYPADLITDARLFEGTRNASSSDCFITYAYWNRRTTPEQALEEMEQKATRNDSSITLVKNATKRTYIDTPEGKKNYTLHQYSLEGPSSLQLKAGLEVGYIPLSNGYIEVQGVCDAAKQLNKTSIVLSAVSLK